jgi:hypothetical protein
MRVMYLFKLESYGVTENNTNANKQNEELLKKAPLIHPANDVMRKFIAKCSSDLVS